MRFRSCSIFTFILVGVLMFCFQWSSNFYDLDSLTSSKCILGPKTTIFRFPRKPLDCSVCANQSSLDTVVTITRKEFEKKYAYSGRPLVIRDAAKHWRAMEAFDYDFFKRLHDTTEMRLCQFINYNDEFQTLNDLFSMDLERLTRRSLIEPWYSGWSVCDPLAVSVLRDYYEKPYFLSELSENHIVDWIFMGTYGHGAKLHVNYENLELKLKIDEVHLPSWQAQIKGKKRWTIETPTECLYTCKESFTVDMKPGDIIVLDTNIWYHGTEVISKEISITVGAEFD